MSEARRLQHVDWDVFLEAHFRPRLVVLHVPPVAGPEDEKSLVADHMATAGFIGNYAHKVDGPAIHVAFDSPATPNDLRVSWEPALGVVSRSGRRGQPSG